ncbi:MAG TPA: Flp pilus assembly protein CpaB [Polyangia bacterium]|nr:Flp pilus assembly protein CpaB [Polyangia bacterium]
MATNDALGGANRFRRGGEGGTRRSGARALAFWVVTIAAGLMAALTITRYLDRHATTSATPMTKVVVAAMDLPLATKLRAEHVKVVDWPQGAQPPGAIHDLKEVVDRIVTSRVLAGEPLLPGKLASKDAGNGLAALIPANMRAVAVRVDDVVGVAGFIHADDRVDVIVTIRPTRPSNAESTSKVILQNVKVLAVGKEIESGDRNRNQANPVTVATLLVNPEESEKLALAANEGRLLLTLRSWTDNAAVATEGMNPSVLLAGDNARQPEAGSPPPVVAAASAPSASPRRGRTTTHRSEVPEAVPEPRKSDVVEILRGDRFEERKFDAKEKK